MSRKHIRPAVAALAAFALLITGCASSGDSGNTGDSGSSAEELQTVRVGYHADWNGASLVAISNDQGYWEEEGLKVEASVFTSGPVEVQALQSDDLDFAYIGQGAMWLPATGAAKIAVINTLSAASRIIAQPGLNSMADLAGKKIGVPEGTSGDLVLTLALEDAGMTRDDVEVVSMDATTIVAAFSSGQIEAAASWYPLISTIKAQVPDLVEVASEAELVAGGGSPTAHVTSNRIVEEDPELVSKFDAVMRKAMDFRAEHTDEAIQITADFLKIPVDVVAGDAENIAIFSASELDAYGESGEVNEWLNNLNAFFIETGSMDSEVDPSTYYLSELWANAGK